MNHVTPQTAILLREAGFKQSEPKLGQIWSVKAVDGSRFAAMIYAIPHAGLLRLVSIEKDFTFSCYIDDDCYDACHCPTQPELMAQCTWTSFGIRGSEFYIENVNQWGHGNICVGQNPAEVTAEFYLEQHENTSPT